ncbi:HupE / UreJ protein [Sphingobacteriaceae bacterium]|nr:HupE / UreJ protein [Sphingobacteriaceae bacterium]
MNEFGLWFMMGMEHILSLGAYDHILFVVLLVLASSLKEWKTLLILVTAFTLGHSISLVLSVNDYITVNSPLIEWMIALTILLSAVYQVINFKKAEHSKKSFLYIIITLFGLVHGLGFSILLKDLLGHEENVILPLLYFNLGIEFGQIIIVGIVLVFSLLLIKIVKWPFHFYKLILTCCITLIALKISVERFLELLQSHS